MVERSIVAAVVYSKGRRRAGKGFSREEIRAAGLSVREALRLRIPVDVRRKTSYEENIRALKDYLGQIRKA